MQQLFYKFIFIILLISNPAFSKDQLLIRGTLEQGGFIRIKFPYKTDVYLNKTQLKQTSNKYVTFGFGRDDDLKHTLSWIDQKGKKQKKILYLHKRNYDIQKIEGVENKYVSPSKESLARIKNDNINIKAVRKKSLKLLYFQEHFIMPSVGRVSGVYGSQRFFNGKSRRPHFGLDIAAKTGTDVIAPAGGKITLIEDMYFSGKTIVLDHGYGISSTFLHLDESLVSVGQYVTQGQLIAKIGATGRVTGAHLDWRLNWFSTRLDPNLSISKK